MSPEKKVGVMAAVTLAILVVAVFVIGKVNMGISGYDLKVRFRFVSGLREDAAVRYAGGPVIGRVRKLEVQDEVVVVHLWLDRNVRIRKDCEFWVYTAGLLGEQYVEVNASPSGTEPHLEPGSVVRGVDPASLDATLIRIGKMVEAFTPVLGRADVSDSLAAILKDLGSSSRKISRLVDRHAGNVDSALGDLAAFSRSLKTMARDFEAISANLKDIADPAKPRSAAAAVERMNEAMERLKKTTETLQSVAKKLDAGEGLLGKLINDKELAQDFKKLIKKLKDEPIRANVDFF